MDGLLKSADSGLQRFFEIWPQPDVPHPKYGVGGSVLFVARRPERADDDPEYPVRLESNPNLFYRLTSTEALMLARYLFNASAAVAPTAEDGK